MKLGKFIFGLLLLLITGCSVSDNESLKESNKCELKFFVNGIQEKASAIYAVSNGNNYDVKNNHFFNDSFESVVSFSEDSYVMDNTRVNKAYSKTASISKLNKGVKYRILVYSLNDNDEETFVEQYDLISNIDDINGVNIDVDMGEKIKWYAYSFNNNESLGSISNVNSPLVNMGINKDFVYDSGVVVINENFVNEEIILRHKTAQIILEIDARGLFTDSINDLLIKIPENTLKTGQFDLKNEKVYGNSISVPDMELGLTRFENFDDLYSDRKYITLYTVEPEVWNNITFELDKLSVLMDDDLSLRNFPKASYTIPINQNIEVGKRYNIKIDLLESAISYNGVQWARSNLYRSNRIRNPYRFYSVNKQTDDFRSYFSFKGHIPGKWGSTIINNQKDPCALVYPSYRWMQPSKADFLTLTRTSTNLTTDGLLPIVISNLIGILGTEATLNATFGTNYIEYTNSNNNNTSYPLSSRILRFYYNGYDPLDLNVLGDGWISLNLIETYGKSAGLWTSDQGINLLGLVGVGGWGYFASTRKDLIFSSQQYAKAINSTQLLNLDVAGLNLVSSARKNVRCVRNPNWENLSKQKGYNPEPKLN